jgi:hypothetical protein
VEVDSIVFSPDAPAFTITADAHKGGINLDIMRAGLVNNSGIVQLLQCVNFDREAAIYFFNNATAGR